MRAIVKESIADLLKPKDPKYVSSARQYKDDVWYNLIASSKNLIKKIKGIIDTDTKILNDIQVIFMRNQPLIKNNFENGVSPEDTAEQLLNLKNTNESIQDLLKPKSEEEIKKAVQKLSGDELWDLWKYTDKKEYLQWACRKQIHNINEDDIADALRADETLEDILFPYILKHFPLDIQKIGNKFYILIDWWDDLAFLLETKGLSVEVVKQILAGEDTYEIFGVDEIEIDDIPDIVAIMEKRNGKKYFSNIISKLKNKIEETTDNLGVVNEAKSTKYLSELIGVVVAYGEYIPEVYNAVENASIDTQTIANESKAINDLKRAIQNTFEFGELNQYYDKNIEKYKIPVTKDNILDIFKMAHEVIDKITYYPPQYGWNGNIYDHPDVFIAALSDKLDDI